MDGLGFAVGIAGYCPPKKREFSKPSWRPFSWHSLDRPVLAPGRHQTARRTPDVGSNPPGVEAPTAPTTTTATRFPAIVSSAESYNAGKRAILYVKWYDCRCWRRGIASVRRGYHQIGRASCRGRG